MNFKLSILIHRPVGEVFSFLRDIDLHERDAKSSVVSLDKISEAPVGIGTKYREIVRMLPFFKGEFLSVITKFQQPECLGMDWSGPGMKGDLIYLFDKLPQGTQLTQIENVHLLGFMRFFTPLVQLFLGIALKRRLNSIKKEIESRTLNYSNPANPSRKVDGSSLSI